MGEAAKKDEDEKLIPVGPGAEGLVQEKPETPEVHEDERLANPEEEEPGQEAAEAHARKRETSRERRERAKKAQARRDLEYNFLLKRNEELEKRFAQLETRTAQTEGAAIDQRITTLQAQLNNADRVLAEALRKPDGAGADEFVEAQKIRDELRDQLGELKRNSQQRQAQTQQPPARRESQPQTPDPRVIRHAREWANQNDWFDFNGQDEDSVIVRAIDEALASDGFDPTTREYWDELTERVKHRLPERFKGARRAPDNDDEDEDERPRAKAGPKFSSGGRERPLKKGEVYVSAERKEAMKQYGVWDDPVARNRMLRKYAEWDAQVAASTNRT